jgi:hypothetical protein
MIVSPQTQGMPNQALEQTRDSVLRYGESVGCELLNFFVRQQEAQSQSNVDMTPIVMAAISTRTLSSAAQKPHVCSSKGFTPCAGLSPATPDGSSGPR